MGLYERRPCITVCFGTIKNPHCSMAKCEALQLMIDRFSFKQTNKKTNITSKQNKQTNKKNPKNKTNKTNKPTIFCFISVILVVHIYGLSHLSRSLCELMCSQFSNYCQCVQTVQFQLIKSWTLISANILNIPRRSKYTMLSPLSDTYSTSVHVGSVIQRQLQLSSHFRVNCLSSYT